MERKVAVSKGKGSYRPTMNGSGAKKAPMRKIHGRGKPVGRPEPASQPYQSSDDSYRTSADGLGILGFAIGLGVLCGIAG